MLDYNLTYLMILSIVTFFSACAVILVGLNVIQPHIHRVGYDDKDWIVVGMSLPLFVQSFHFGIQAFQILISPDWVSLVRAMTVALPIMLVVHLLNGRVNEFVNSTLKKVKQWTFR